MFAYWDDLKFGPGPQGGDPGSGIYFFVDGDAPNRRLVIEWHKMQYAASPNPTDIISFNLISSSNPSTIAANIALGFPEATGLRVNALTHMIDRVCVERCYRAKRQITVI